MDPYDPPSDRHNYSKHSHDDNGGGHCAGDDPFLQALALLRERGAAASREIEKRRTIDSQLPV